MFQSGDLLNQRYQLQHCLGKTLTGQQTWLALDLASQPVLLHYLLSRNIGQRWLNHPMTNVIKQMFGVSSPETVVIKLFGFSPQAQWEAFNLFERQAKVLQKLDHPQIPHYRDYFQFTPNGENNIAWFALVQDYIRGYVLQELINQGKHFSEKEIRYLAKDVLEILIYLQQFDPPIIHRDIKPSNLVLGFDEKIYLIDFGAVRDETSLTGVTFTVVGTGGYAPLEQFWGKSVPASDLYGLGATLIHLATGIPPIELSPDNTQLQFSDRLNFSRGLTNWLTQMTALALDHRFTNAQEALNALKFVGKPRFLKANFLDKSSQSAADISETHQPESTKIKLKKNPEKLIINLPNQASFFSPLLQTLITKILPIKPENKKIQNLSLIGIYLFLLSGLYGLSWYEQNFSLFYSIALPLSLFILIRLIDLLRQQAVSFEKVNFKLFYKLFFIPYKINQENYQQFLGVCLHQKKAEKWQISLNTATKIYFLPETSHAEATWLIQEIQNWLKEQENV